MTEVNNNSDEFEVQALPSSSSSSDDGGLVKAKTDDHGDAKAATATAAAGDKEDMAMVESADDLNSFWERQAKRVARNSCAHFWAALILAIVLSAIAIVVGEFTVSANTGGWTSRGTLIGDRHTQVGLVNSFQVSLATGGDDAWLELINNVQSGWEDDDDEVDRRRSLRGGGEADPDQDYWIERGLSERYDFPAQAQTFADLMTPTPDRILSLQQEQRRAATRKIPFQSATTMTVNEGNGEARRLQTDLSGIIPGCDISASSMTILFSEARLWPVWKTSSKYKTALDPAVMEDLCVAEQNSLKVLEDNNFCDKCAEGGTKCVPPLSIVFYARLQIADGFSLTCAELAEAWAPLQASTEDQWQSCVKTLKTEYDPESETLPEECPLGFSTMMVNDDFDETKLVTYTSSVFYSDPNKTDAIYDVEGQFDRGTSKIEGVYDTQHEDFNNIYVDSMLNRDMALAMGSAILVAIAILVHTRSLMLTGVGLLQIIFSFPLAYFVYKLILGLDFFPFLNFIGVFVIFALGADDVFVAVDKWKNARLDHPAASTEYVAAAALPDAASAMFLTTVTTAVAFFATAICPVAPVKMFAIFCGLLVLFDYLMNVVLVFPALCIYDHYIRASPNGRPNCCISFTCCNRGGNDDDENNDDMEVADATGASGATNQEKPSLIRRAMLAHFEFASKTRWILLVMSGAALGITAYYASTFSLPLSSDVRLLAEDFEYEKNFLWRQKLFYDQLQRSGGSTAFVIWGVNPADTGDHNDPGTWSTLELDSRFDASSEAAQEHILGFCDDMFSNEFASKPTSDYVCAFNRFDAWLKEESIKDDQAAIYQEHCGSAAGVPVAPENFDACIGAWAQSEGDTSILLYEGKVQIVFFTFVSTVRYDDPYDVLDDEWNEIEDWMGQKNADAPNGCNRAYFSSEDFWWYDTNGQMLRTAYGSAGIALGAAALMLLLTSQSLILTLFSTLTIGYVLTSVIATLVSLGWTLGFLESICVAILIGVSADFVLHFSHAYATLPGDASKEERTKYALVKMGPSILAAAFTTMASACVMLFTVITFFQKFAVILFMTIIQATAGSFIVFVALVLCVGPTNPTRLFDMIVEKCKGGKKDDEDAAN